jgi:hypothetical protein
MLYNDWQNEYVPKNRINLLTKEAKAHNWISIVYSEKLLFGFPYRRL